MNADLGRHNKRVGLEETASEACGPSKPCIGCRHATRCASFNLGCDALAVFEAVGASAARLAYAPRQPSAAIYERIDAFKAKRKTAPPPFRRPAIEDEAD
jgi:hypothetical protein